MLCTVVKLGELSMRSWVWIEGGVEIGWEQVSMGSESVVTLFAFCALGACGAWSGGVASVKRWKLLALSP